MGAVIVGILGLVAVAVTFHTKLWLRITDILVGVIMISLVVMLPIEKVVTTSPAVLFVLAFFLSLETGLISRTIISHTKMGIRMMLLLYLMVLIAFSLGTIIEPATHVLLGANVPLR